MILGELLRFLAQIINIVIWIYIVVIIVRSILSWVGNIPRNDFIIILRRLTDPLFRLVHKIFPFSIVGGIDISPIIILLFLHFLNRIIYTGLMKVSLRLIAGG